MTTQEDKPLLQFIYHLLFLALISTLSYILLLAKDFSCLVCADSIEAVLAPLKQLKEDLKKQIHTLQLARIHHPLTFSVGCALAYYLQHIWPFLTLRTNPHFHQIYLSALPNKLALDVSFGDLKVYYHIENLEVY